MAPSRSGYLLALALVGAGCASAEPQLEQASSADQGRVLAELDRGMSRLEGTFTDMERVQGELSYEIDALLTKVKRLENENANLSNLLYTLCNRFAVPEEEGVPVAHVDRPWRKISLSAPLVAFQCTVQAVATGGRGITLAIGTRHVVKVGDEFTVFRGDRFVAVVVVESVNSETAEAAVKVLAGKAMMKGEIRPGDSAATLSP